MSGTSDSALEIANEEGRLAALQLLVDLGRRGEGYPLAFTIARMAGVLAAIAQSSVLLTSLPRCPVSADEILESLREHFDQAATDAKVKTARRRH